MYNYNNMNYEQEGEPINPKIKQKEPVRFRWSADILSTYRL